MRRLVILSMYISGNVGIILIANILSQDFAARLFFGFVFGGAYAMFVVDAWREAGAKR